MRKPRPEPFADERQPILFGELPLPPVKRSDQRALDDVLTMVETLEAAKTHPWSERLVGWQRRRLAALSKLLTPIEAAALAARFEGELERLGPPADFWAETEG